jgi:hypothetical protein
MRGTAQRLAVSVFFLVHFLICHCQKQRIWKEAMKLKGMFGFLQIKRSCWSFLGTKNQGR